MVWQVSVQIVCLPELPDFILPEVLKDHIFRITGVVRVIHNPENPAYDLHTVIFICEFKGAVLIQGVRAFFAQTFDMHAGTGVADHILTNSSSGGVLHIDPVILFIYWQHAVTFDTDDCVSSFIPAIQEHETVILYRDITVIETVTRCSCGGNDGDNMGILF